MTAKRPASSSPMSIVERNFWVFFSLAIVAGLAIPNYVKWLSDYSTYVLMLILFIVFLKIDLREILGHVQRPLLLAYVLLMNLLIIPLLFYLFSSPLSEEVRVGILLLLSLPTGVSTAALTDLIKGKTSLTVAITVLSTLLVPITMTSLFSLLLQKQLSVPFSRMLLALVMLVVVPLIVSQFFKPLFGKTTVRIAKHANAFTILLLTAIIAGVIGKNAGEVFSNLNEVLYLLIILYVVFFLVQLFGYFMVFWLRKDEKLAISTAKTYGNPVLGIVLASTFFSPKVTLFLILSEIPWTTTLGVFNRFKQYLP